MNKKENIDVEKHGPMVKPFTRDFYSETDEFTYIGDGPMGGKAQGLAHIKEKILSHFRGREDMSIIVDIPRLTVITTAYFDRFMQQNDLYDIAFSDLSDERIAHHFLKAQLPAQLTGDLRALIANVHSPLAVRSSSLLEDSLENPFAGVYHTKMIPNNQPDIDTRFHKLTEAVKLVYASTYFNNAKSYIKTTSHSIRDEKMAVIIQEVVGLHHNKRFYPNISGVARSYNFYPSSNAKPEEGVVNLALGLGKTIVDGGAAWSYSPEYPEVAPPYSSVSDLMDHTQVEFWAVNMDKPGDYDPVKETEYMIKPGLREAEYDNTLALIASTYDYESDRINMGIGFSGARVLNFAPILHLDLVPVNRLIKNILEICEQVLKAKVEIEFAVTIRDIGGGKKEVRFGLLQVRPMAISHRMVDLDEDAMTPERMLAASGRAMGNGSMDSLRDIIYVVPERFTQRNSGEAALEVAQFNREMLGAGTPYVLIGFGRWGSSDPWLGIPVQLPQISGARVIVESNLPGAHIDLSQGSHFFHNITNLGIFYLSVKPDTPFQIDWQWLEKQTVVRDGKYVRHVRTASPLTVKVDGRKRKGVILK